MKIKLIQNKSGRNLLKVSLTKKDSFDYAVASQLSAGTQEFFLPFTFSGSNNNPDLYYDLTDCIPLNTLLGSRISRQQLDSVIKQIVSTLDTLSTSNLAEKNLLLALEHVYLAAKDSKLKLVYLPLTGRTSDDRVVLNLMEEFVTGSRFTSDADSQYAQSLLDFLKKQSVFSVIAFKTFFGMPVTSSASKPTGNAKPAQSILEQNNVPSSTARDFVRDRSGVLSKAQVAEQRSTAETILAAVSENLEGSSPLPGTSSAPDIKQSAVVLQPPAPQTSSSQLLEPQPDETETACQVDSNDLASKTSGETVPEAKALPHYWLVREQDNMRWELTKGAIIIGRSMTCDLQVSDSTSVSRQHAVLTHTSEGLTLTDKNSKNGTAVNGVTLRPEQPMFLHGGSTLKLGDVRFSIVKD